MIVTQELISEIRKLKVGDYSSYSVFYDTTATYLYKVIMDIVASKEDADNILPDVYNQIYQSINKLQNENEFYLWSAYIATDVAFAYINSLNRFHLDEIPQSIGAFEYSYASEDKEEFVPENILEDNEIQCMIKDMMDKLPIACKIVLQYFYYEELSIAEISNKLNCEDVYVRNCVQYIKNQLKTIVEYYPSSYGIRLLSLSQVPIFWLVFQNTINFVSGAVGVINAVGVAGSGSVGATGAGMIGTNVAGSAGVAGANAAGSVGAGVASSAGSVAVGATTVAATGFGIGAKIAIGTVICATLVGGGIGASHLIENYIDKQVSEKVAVAEAEIMQFINEEENQDLTDIATDLTVEHTIEDATTEITETTEMTTEITTEIVELTPLEQMNQLMPETVGWTEADWLACANSIFDGSAPVYDTLDRDVECCHRLYNIFQSYAMPIDICETDNNTYIDLNGMRYYLVTNYDSEEEAYEDFYKIFSKENEVTIDLVEVDGQLYLTSLAGNVVENLCLYKINGLVRLEKIDVENKEIIFIEECEYTEQPQDPSSGITKKEYEFSLIFEDGGWKVNKMEKFY